MSRRSEQLRAIAQEFCRVHDAWVENENKPSPDEEYWDAADAMIESFSSGEIPGDCRTLDDAIQAFADQVEKFDNRDNPEVSYPGESFWAAREKIAAILLEAAQGKVAKALTPLETIPVLVAQGVNLLTIAKIYGFKDRNGEWMLGLVQKEIDQPGSVLRTPGAIDGRDWKDPRVKDDEAGNAVGERHATALAEKSKRAGDKAAKKSKPCPETPKELWQQKVSVQQAAKMLLLDEAEVAAMFERFDDEREASILRGAAPDAVTQAIRQLAAAGKSSRAIAAELKVSPEQVKAAMAGVVKPAAKETAAAGA